MPDPPVSSTSGTIFGALKNVIDLQERFETYLFIADLHAITDGFEAKLLRRHTLETAAMFLALGFDPDSATLFVQSHVTRHAELARLLSAVCRVGELKRMIQFKEKALKGGQESALSLLDYPVLMAADILLYGADVVPVGDDQRQHLELACLLARRFNKTYRRDGEPVFTVPQALTPVAAARIMSLTDGRKKMSKSDANEASRIGLADSEDEIRSKIKRARTDSGTGLEFGNEERPEVDNLLTIYQVLGGRAKEEVGEECASIGFGEFKKRLADVVVACLAPIRKRYIELMSAEDHLVDVLRGGALKASARADATYGAARAAMGFLDP